MTELLDIVVYIEYILASRSPLRHTSDRATSSHLAPSAQAPLAANLRLTDQTVKMCTELAQRMGRELKAAHSALSRARTELHRKHLEAEGIHAEYQKLASGVAMRHGLSSTGSRGVSEGEGGGKADAKKAAAADKGADRLARLCQKLAIANTRVRQAEEGYRRERSKSTVSTWKHCGIEVPAVCIHLKGLEARRAEVLQGCLEQAVEAMGMLPTAAADGAWRAESAEALAARLTSEATL